MTLMDLLREHGRVDMRIVSQNGSQAAVFVQAGGRDFPMRLDEMKPLVGGSLCTVEAVAPAAKVAAPVDAVVGDRPGWTCAPDALVCEACQ